MLSFEYSYANLVNGELRPEFLERHRARPAKSIADIGHTPDVICICLTCRLFFSGCIRNATAGNLCLAGTIQGSEQNTGISKIFGKIFYLPLWERFLLQKYFTFSLKCYLFFYIKFFLNLIRNKFLNVFYMCYKNDNSYLYYHKNVSLFPYIWFEIMLDKFTIASLSYNYQ